MTQITSSSQIIKKSHDELILVVKRSHLMPRQGFQGLLRGDCNAYLEIIKEHQEFLPRTQMEQDPVYKQIIPYLIFKHNDHYFLMQRHHKASEVRLQNLFTLGIGGHIRKEDMNSQDIFYWAQREFNEEVHYDGDLTIEPLGMLNDDSNDVGKVHIGFVFLLHGNSANISIKSELKWGALIPAHDCKKYVDQMESWSQIIMPFLT